MFVNGNFKKRQATNLKLYNLKKIMKIKSNEMKMVLNSWYCETCFLVFVSKMTERKKECEPQLG